MALLPGLSHRLTARVSRAALSRAALSCAALSSAALLSAPGCLPREDLGGYSRDWEIQPDSGGDTGEVATADAAAHGDAQADARVDAAIGLDAGLVDAAGPIGLEDGGPGDAAVAPGLRSTDAAVAVGTANAFADAQPAAL